MMQTRTRHEFSTSAMADIGFLLLIFFFVATQILDEQGIPVTLPAYDTRSTPVPEHDIFHIHVNAGDAILAGKQHTNLEGLGEVIYHMITKNDPAHARRTIISLHCDRESTYSTFFGVYESLRHTYRRVWNEMSMTRYGTSFSQLDEMRRRQIMEVVPLIVSEAEWNR